MGENKMKKLLIFLSIFFISSQILISGEKEGNELLKKGIEALSQEKIENALEFFIKSTEEKANFAQGYYYIGLCYAKLGEIEKAKQNLIYAKVLTDEDDLKNEITKVLEDIENGKYEKVNVVKVDEKEQQEIKEEVKSEEQKETEEKEKVKLSYKFNKGDVSYYGLNIKDKEKGKINNSPFQREQNIYIEFKEEVIDIDENGNGTTKLTLVRATYEGQDVGEKGKEAYIKFTPKGKIIESQNLQEIIDQFLKVIRKSIAGVVPGFDRIPLNIDLKKFPSNEFNAFWEVAKPILPEEEIEVGGSWETPPSGWQRDIGQKQPIKYTLKTKEGNNATIEIKMEQEENKINGQAVFDLEKGKVIKQNITVIIPKAKGSIDSKDIEKTGIMKGVPSFKMSYEIEKQTTFNMNFLNK